MAKSASMKLPKSASLGRQGSLRTASGRERQLDSPRQRPHPGRLALVFGTTTSDASSRSPRTASGRADETAPAPKPGRLPSLHLPKVFGGLLYPGSKRQAATAEVERQEAQQNINPQVRDIDFATWIYEGGCRCV